MDKDIPIILEDRDKLLKINPWRIDLKQEIEKIMKFFEVNGLNYILAGYAADNSSLIFKRKVETIDNITKASRRRSMGHTDKTLVLPEIEVAHLIGKPVIDLSDIIERLSEILERRMSMKAGISDEEGIEILSDYYTETMLSEDRIQEIWRILSNALDIIKPQISIFEIIETLSQYTPYTILFAIIFLYMDGKLDIEVVEEEGIARDIIIKKVE